MNSERQNKKVTTIVYSKMIKKCILEGKIKINIFALLNVKKFREIVEMIVVNEFRLICAFLF